MLHLKKMTLLGLLLLASLACSLTNQRPGQAALLQVIETRQPPTPPATARRAIETPHPTPQGLAACEVTTGYPGGTVNLRACAGLACPVLAVLHEGDRLTILTPGHWPEVETGSGTTGYIHSKFCTRKE